MRIILKKDFEYTIEEDNGVFTINVVCNIGPAEWLQQEVVSEEDVKILLNNGDKLIEFVDKIKNKVIDASPYYKKR